ncbi:MAG: SDR family oxidoreductase [Candidatus Aminicenantes bacterium]|nr:SDR family oxidoreductase [Candidatus Aminicenantes bacterium]
MTNKKNFDAVETGMGCLDNKIIVVTGGSRGIGFSVARRCAKEGARLVLISRDRSNLEKAAVKVSSGRQNHRCYECDVGRPENVKDIVSAVENEFSVVHGLVNCAGISGVIGRIDEIDPAGFVQTIKVNLLGTFYMCHYFIPLLKKAERGKIVNFSGGGAAGPFPNYSAYAASKAGVVRLTENMAVELQNDNLDINVVAPGFIATEIHQETIKAGMKAGEGYLKKTMELIKKGGVSPEIPARLTAFLLSSQSDGITGKFLSAPWDPWEDRDFQTLLRNDKDFATIRRIDNRIFYKRG